MAAVRSGTGDELEKAMFNRIYITLKCGTTNELKVICDGFPAARIMAFYTGLASQCFVCGAITVNEISEAEHFYCERMMLNKVTTMREMILDRTKTF